MTKAKTVKQPAKAKDDAEADAAKAKKVKAPAKAKEKSTVAESAKPTKAAGVAKAAKEAKKPAAAKAEPKETAAKTKPAKAKSKDTQAIVRSAETAPVAEPKPAPAPVPPPKPAVAFSNSGLGVKIATKKPGLSVAPGVMILGRPAAVKQEVTVRPSERRLSKKETGDIKNELLERRERLLAGMRREFAMQRERAESKAADEVDKATDAYDEDLSFEIATANDQELEEIQVALEKIERGTYGECEICGTNISPSRLKILPSATTCVSCRGQEELARRRDESPSFNMFSADDAETDAGEM